MSAAHRYMGTITKVVKAKHVLIPGNRVPRIPKHSLQGHVTVYNDDCDNITSSDNHKVFAFLKTIAQFNDHSTLDSIFTTLGYTAPTYDATNLVTRGDSSRKVLLSNQNLRMWMKNNCDRPARVKLYFLRAKQDILKSKATELTEGWKEKGLTNSVFQNLSVDFKDNKWLVTHFKVVTTRQFNLTPGQQEFINVTLNKPQVQTFQYKARAIATGFTTVYAKKGEYLILAEINGSLVANNTDAGICTCQVEFFYSKKYTYSSVANNFQNVSENTTCTPVTLATDIHTLDADGGPVDIP